MENFQEATSRQVKLLTNRLKEALSSGLELLHSELGVDLGLKPELIPPWVILLASCIGLVLLVALWASACRFLFKRRPAAVDGGFGVKPDGMKPAVKPEDQKKKKKKTEKKAQEAQPNGRAVPEALEEATVSEEIVPHHQSPPPQGKTENVTEVKKSKKKAKLVVKETKTATADGKEPEEGTWETKVSNKEKREQRKKEKTPSDGSASPGGGNASNSAPQELPKPAPVQAPAAQKKKKGESTKVKVEKVEAVAAQVRSSEPASSSTKAAVKAPAHTAAQAPGRWAAKRESATLWGSEIDGSWTVIESGMKTSDQIQVSSFSGLGAAEPLPDLPWSGKPKVEDEWSGQNGGTVDTSSDWNAPAEAWGNYEEPAPSPPVAQKVAPPEPAKIHLLMEAADDEDDDKDKADAGGKTKKRKKKKRKVAEEGGQGSQDSEEPEKEVVHEAPVKKQQPTQEKAPAVQPAKTAAAAAAAEARVERPMKETVSQKTPVTQVPQKPSEAEPTAKQNHLPAPAQQKKIEESQAPKPVKKKKARRET